MSGGPVPLAAAANRSRSDRVLDLSKNRTLDIGQLGSENHHLRYRPLADFAIVYVVANVLFCVFWERFSHFIRLKTTGFGRKAIVFDDNWTDSFRYRWRRISIRTGKKLLLPLCLSPNGGKQDSLEVPERGDYYYFPLPWYSGARGNQYFRLPGRT